MHTHTHTHTHTTKKRSRRKMSVYGQAMAAPPLTPCTKSPAVSSSLSSNTHTHLKSLHNHLSTFTHTYGLPSLRRAHRLAKKWGVRVCVYAQEHGLPRLKKGVGRLQKLMKKGLKKVGEKVKEKLFVKEEEVAVSGNGKGGKKRK
jgi:hypothetical protein